MGKDTPPLAMGKPLLIYATIPRGVEQISVIGMPSYLEYHAISMGRRYTRLSTHRRVATVSSTRHPSSASFLGLFVSMESPRVMSSSRGKRGGMTTRGIGIVLKRSGTTSSFSRIPLRDTGRRTDISTLAASLFSG